jgi:hypothetical protein
MVRLLLLVATAIGAALAPAMVLADPGVGVNLGEIKVEDRLARGGRYKLPELGVTNTGSAAGAYQVVVGRAGGQSKRMPDPGWFELRPSTFHLDPGQSQAVAISLTLPPNAPAADYFAYIQASPVSSLEGASIGIAAATKLEFTVKPSSLFEAWRIVLTRKAESLQPWLSIVAALVVAGIAVRAFRQRFALDVKVVRKG